MSIVKNKDEDMLKVERRALRKLRRKANKLNKL